MDMSFANQALGAEYMRKQASKLEPQVYDVPERHRPRDRPPQAGVDGRRRSTR